MGLPSEGKYSFPSTNFQGRKFQGGYLTKLLYNWQNQGRWRLFFPPLEIEIYWENISMINPCHTNGWSFFEQPVPTHAKLEELGLTMGVWKVFHVSSIFRGKNGTFTLEGFALWSCPFFFLHITLVRIIAMSHDIFGPQKLADEGKSGNPRKFQRNQSRISFRNPGCWNIVI